MLVSELCEDDGVGCDGTDCECACHDPAAPFFATDADVAEYHS